MASGIYLALGDSITAGYEASAPERTYIHRVASEIKRRNLATQTIVLAKNGWDSTRLLNAMYTISPTIWRQCSISTVMIGGNDLREILKRMWSPIPESQLRMMIDAQLVRFERNYEQIIQMVTQYVPHVRTATVYNPIPNSPIAAQTFTRMNEIVSDVSSTQDIPVVDIYGQFSNRAFRLINRYQNGALQDLMRPFWRPIHPNDLGHQKIADAFIRTLPNE